MIETEPPNTLLEWTRKTALLKGQLVGLSTGQYVNGAGSSYEEFSNGRVC